MATLAQLEAEDRASRSTIPDVPSGPETVIVNDEPEERPSAVETAPLTLPKTALPAPPPAQPARSPWPMVVAALVVAGAAAAFFATR